MVPPVLRRVAGIVGLVSLLVLLMIRFGSVSPNPALGNYPSSGHLVVDYGQYVGDRVQVTGTVTRTDPIIIEDDYAIWVGDSYRTGTVRIRITGLERPVRRGQILQVYGIAQPDGAVRPVNSVVVPGINLLYMYIVSALAGCWVLYRLLRGWRLDRAALAVRRRQDPLNRSEVIRFLMGTEGKRDG